MEYETNTDTHVHKTAQIRITDDYDDTIVTIEYDSEEADCTFFRIRGKLTLIPLSLDELKNAIDALSGTVS